MRLSVGGLTVALTVRWGIIFWFALLFAGMLHASCPLNGEQQDQRALDLAREAAEAIPPEEERALPAWRAAVDQSRDCLEKFATQSNGERLFGVLAQASSTLERGAHVESAYQYMTEALAVAERFELPRGRFQALETLARIDTRSGRLLEATTSYKNIIALAERQNWQKEKADALSGLANIERRRTNYFASLSYERASLAVRRTLPEPNNMWRSVLSLAVLYEQIELMDEARNNYLLAVEMTKSEDPVDHAGARLRYADFLNDFDAGHATEALAFAESALPVLAKIDPVREASALLQIGRARTALGQFEAALNSFQRAHSLAIQSDARTMSAHIQFRWGELEFLRGDFDSALARIGQAQAIYQDGENRHRLIKVYGLLERVYLAQGKELESLRAGREHYRLRNEVLGVGATQKLSELLGDFELNEERARNAELKVQNEINQLAVKAQGRERWLAVAVVVVILIAFLSMLVRYRQARLFNAKLQANQRELTHANETLKAKSAELFHATITDPLTGLRNRRYAMAKLAECFRSGTPRLQSIALMIMDLDHFKNINDLYGHASGDEVLIKATFALTKAMPNHVQLSRIGGEEFFAYVEGETLEQVLRWAELARVAVAAETIEIAGGSLRITVSMGVHYLPEGSNVGLSQALRTTDEALYEAKNAGRNCVRVYRGNAPV